MIERSFTEYNSHETVNIYPSLNDQQFRLNKQVKSEYISLARLKKEN